VNRTLAAAGSAVALALCGAGAAAANAGHTGSAPGAKPAQDNLVGAVAVFDAAIAYLEIDKLALFQDLKGGQSLAQIAAAQGKTADGLVDAVVDAAQTQLDAAVTLGKLGNAREQVVLAKLRTAVTALVTKTRAAATQAGTRPLPVTMFFQPVLTRVQLHIVTVPNKVKLKTGAAASGNGGNS
jgi:hypothetical protein